MASSAFVSPHDIQDLLGEISSDGEVTDATSSSCSQKGCAFAVGTADAPEGPDVSHGGSGAAPESAGKRSVGGKRSSSGGNESSPSESDAEQGGVKHGGVAPAVSADAASLTRPADSSVQEPDPVDHNCMPSAVNLSSPFNASQLVASLLGSDVASESGTGNGSGDAEDNNVEEDLGSLDDCPVRAAMPLNHSVPAHPSSSTAEEVDFTADVPIHSAAASGMRAPDVLPEAAAAAEDDGSAQSEVTATSQSVTGDALPFSANTAIRHEPQLSPAYQEAATSNHWRASKWSGAIATCEAVSHDPEPTGRCMPPELRWSAIVAGGDKPLAKSMGTSPDKGNETMNSGNGFSGIADSVTESFASVEKALSIDKFDDVDHFGSSGAALRADAEGQLNLASRDSPVTHLGASQFVNRAAVLGVSKQSRPAVPLISRARVGFVSPARPPRRSIQSGSELASGAELAYASQSAGRNHTTSTQPSDSRSSSSVDHAASPPLASQPFRRSDDTQSRLLACQRLPSSPSSSEHDFDCSIMLAPSPRNASGRAAPDAEQVGSGMALRTLSPATQPPKAQKSSNVRRPRKPTPLPTTSSLPAPPVAVPPSASHSAARKNSVPGRLSQRPKPVPARPVRPLRREAHDAEAGEAEARGSNGGLWIGHGDTSVLQPSEAPQQAYVQGSAHLLLPSSESSPLVAFPLAHAQSGMEVSQAAVPEPHGGTAASESCAAAAVALNPSPRSLSTTFAIASPARDTMPPPQCSLQRQECAAETGPATPEKHPAAQPVVSPQGQHTPVRHTPGTEIAIAVDGVGEHAAKSVPSPLDLAPVRLDTSARESTKAPPCLSKEHAEIQQPDPPQLVRPSALDSCLPARHEWPNEEKDTTTPMGEKAAAVTAEVEQHRQPRLHEDNRVAEEQPLPTSHRSPALAPVCGPRGVGGGGSSFSSAGVGDNFHTHRSGISDSTYAQEPCARQGSRSSSSVGEAALEAFAQLLGVGFCGRSSEFDGQPRPRSSVGLLSQRPEPGSRSTPSEGSYGEQAQNTPATASSICEASITATRQRLLHLRTQVSSLSECNDALEKMAAGFSGQASGMAANGSSIASALAKVHADAMRGAADQVAACRVKPASVVKDESATKAEALVKVRQWIADATPDSAAGRQRSLHKQPRQQRQPSPLKPHQRAHLAHVGDLSQQLRKAAFAIGDTKNCAPGFEEPDRFLDASLNSVVAPYIGVTSPAAAQMPQAPVGVSDAVGVVTTSARITRGGQGRQQPASNIGEVPTVHL